MQQELTEAQIALLPAVLATDPAHGARSLLMRRDSRIVKLPPNLMDPLILKQFLHNATNKLSKVLADPIEGLVLMDSAAAAWRLRVALGIASLSSPDTYRHSAYGRVPPLPVAATLPAIHAPHLPRTAPRMCLNFVPRGAMDITVRLNAPVDDADTLDELLRLITRACGVSNGAWQNASICVQPHVVDDAWPRVVMDCAISAARLRQLLTIAAG
jgi:hypothetical protein